MCDSSCSHALDRRGLLRAGAAAAAAGTLLRVDPASAVRRGKVKRYTFTGSFTDPTTPDWHYLPFKVPAGVRRIDVSYTFEPTDLGPISTNVVDIGIFDPSGKGLGNEEGFRGWSGGARREFFLTRGRATPGYLAGPLTPGRWHVILGPYLITPPGTPYEVVVELTFGDKAPRFEPSYAPQAIAGTGPAWYRGDLHTHTVHSDGSHTQKSLAAEAQAAGLDLLGSSEHNTSSATLTWGRHAPADLLVVNGEEVTTRAGHWLAMGLPPGTWIDWRYRAQDAKLERFTDRVHELGGVAIVAHPYNPVPSIKWGQNLDYAGMDAVELWNGAWTSDDRATVTAWHAALVAGSFVPGVGSSDSHNTGQKVGTPQTAYRMDTLSTAALLDAVRGGHCWIAASSAIDLTFTAAVGEGAPVSCGDRLQAAPSDTVAVRLHVTGLAAGTFGVLYGASGPLGFGLTDDSGQLLVETDVPAGAQLVRAEVGFPKSSAQTPDQGTVVDGMLALTNPIFLSDAAATP